MSWFLTVIFLVVTLTFHTPSEASHEKNHPSAVVVGTVYCDTCFQEDFSHTSHFISGASVGVECKDGSSTEQSFKAQVKTNSHGQFKVLLPFSVSKHVKKIEGCSVKLISSSEPYCAVASSATASSLHLKARKQGTHIFSAGFFTFKPLKQPTLCNQKPSIQNSKKLNSQKVSFPHTDELEFPSPSQVDPTMPDLPPIPMIPILPPLPQLPPLPLPPVPLIPPIPIGVPGLPGIPVSPPVAVKTSSVSSNTKTSKNEQLGDNKEVAHPDTIFPPLFPPLIPNPFQPPPLIPNPLQPPAAPLIPNLPPLPGSPPASPAPLIPNLPPVPLVPNLPPVPLVPNLPPLPLVPNLPPIPGLTPPSSPPPIIPFLPPLPFPLPPVPRIPGIPPASSSKQSTSP